MLNPKGRPSFRKNPRILGKEGRITEEERQYRPLKDVLPSSGGYLYCSQSHVQVEVTKKICGGGGGRSTGSRLRLGQMAEQPKFGLKKKSLSLHLCVAKERRHIKGGWELTQRSFEYLGNINRM